MRRQGGHYGGDGGGGEKDERHQSQWRWERDATQAKLPQSAISPTPPFVEEKEDAAAPRQRLSCTKYFDALWFCYSPVHQLQQYYRLGVLDNCSGKWSILYDCLSLKTKRASEVEEILEAREKTREHIWTFKSPAEARSHWEKLFGHLDGEE